MLGLDQIITPLDMTALALFLAAMFGYGMFCSMRGVEAGSLVGAIQRQRVAWMLNMASRDNRVLDDHAALVRGDDSIFLHSLSFCLSGLIPSG